MVRSKRTPWRPSPDPEVFDDDAEQEWVVDRIASEEIDVFGKRWLEIKWGEWQRADGTNTTWQEDLENEEVLESWVKNVEDTRVRLAREDLAIELQDLSTPSHLYHTIEAANAYDHKLKSPKRLGSRYKHWSLLPHAQSSNDSSQRSSRGRESVPPPRGPTSSKRAAPPPSEERHIKKNKTAAPTARQVLLHKWLRACRIAGASQIRIVNEVDDEEIPPLAPHFVYLESEYDFGDLTFEDDEEYLAGCECAGSCEEEDCSCQTIISDEDDPTPAYNAEGMFTLDRSVVVECNKLCTCDEAQCRNRVAQKGRDIEIEIFRTVNRGWGARALSDLPKGKHLGLYTGRLIPREEAARLPDAHRSYTFDLDSLDNGPGVPTDRRYSVDAHSHGNWTRFVNHSCNSNVQVYSVMWDSMPQMNRPYLAFVANQDIPAKTELTIDYDPKSALDKGKRRRPPGAKECRCGSDRCRGWVAV